MKSLDINQNLLKNHLAKMSWLFQIFWIASFTIQTLLVPPIWPVPLSGIANCTHPHFQCFHHHTPPHGPQNRWGSLQACRRASTHLLHSDCHHHIAHKCQSECCYKTTMCIHSNSRLQCLYFHHHIPLEVPVYHCRNEASYKQRQPRKRIPNSSCLMLAFWLL